MSGCRTGSPSGMDGRIKSDNRISMKKQKIMKQILGSVLICIWLFLVLLCWIYISPGLCLWFVLISGGIAFYLWWKRRHSVVSEESESMPKSVLPSKYEIAVDWTELPCNLLFDEKYGYLRYEEKAAIRLSGNSLRLFRSFVNAEGYKLTYEDICIDVLARPIKGGILKGDKSVMSAAVCSLRESLKSCPCIRIEAIRGVGYQLFIDLPDVSL